MSKKRPEEPSEVSRRRMMGPGVVRRRRPASEDDLLVTRRGIESDPETEAPALAASRPEHDPELPLVDPSGERRIAQLLAPSRTSTQLDVVLSIADRPTRWNVFARTPGGETWHPVHGDPRGAFSASLPGAELQIDGPEASSDDSEPGEVAWRFSVTNAGTKGADAVVRLVLELAE